MRTRREIKRDIRRSERDVRAASVADDGERFVELRRILERLRKELADLDAPPDAPALPPGDGVFRMRQTPTAAGRAAPEDDEAARWRRVIAMRRGPSEASRKIYDPDRDARRRTDDVSALTRDAVNVWGRRR